MHRTGNRMTANGDPLLDVRDIALRFGGIVALDGVSFTIDDGQILGLIGPNGAGKTTLFNCVSRLYNPNRGDILFEGRSMLSRPAHRIAEIGIARTFQNLALFGPQSVIDNVRVGGRRAKLLHDFVSDAFKLPWDLRCREAVLTGDRMVAVAASRSRRRRPPPSRRFVAWARANGSNWPRRPPGGAQIVAARRAGGRPGRMAKSANSARLIRRIRDQRRVTVLLVEHHMNLVMSISDKVVAPGFRPQNRRGNARRGAAQRGRHPRLSRNDPRARRMMTGPCC